MDNIHGVILDLFNHNLIRGRGLLARSVLKAQSASKNFTHVFAALVAVINTKLPDVVKILVHRVIFFFQRSYRHGNKQSYLSSLKMIAHLVNQQVVHELLALQLLA